VAFLTSVLPFCTPSWLYSTLSCIRCSRCTFCFPCIIPTFSSCFFVLSMLFLSSKFHIFSWFYSQVLIFDCCINSVNESIPLFINTIFIFSKSIILELAIISILLVLKVHQIQFQYFTWAQLLELILRRQRIQLINAYTNVLNHQIIGSAYV